MTKLLSKVITACVRSTREGNVLTRVCPSIHPQICLSTGRGSGPAGGGSGLAAQGGGSGPADVGGWVRSSQQGGLGGQVQPTGGSGPAGGGQVQPAGGGGSGPAGGGVSQDRTTEWVLSTWQAVCLLRSCRRTFLFQETSDLSPFGWPLREHDVPLNNLRQLVKNAFSHVYLSVHRKAGRKGRPFFCGKDQVGRRPQEGPTRSECTWRAGQEGVSPTKIRLETPSQRLGWELLLLDW